MYYTGDDKGNAVPPKIIKFNPIESIEIEDFTYFIDEISYEWCIETHQFIAINSKTIYITDGKDAARMGPGTNFERVFKLKYGFTKYCFNRIRGIIDKDYHMGNTCLPGQYKPT